MEGVWQEGLELNKKPNVVPYTGVFPASELGEVQGAIEGLAHFLRRISRDLSLMRSPSKSAGSMREPCSFSMRFSNRDSGQYDHLRCSIR